MNITAKDRKVTDSRLISGVLRECLFYGAGIDLSEHGSWDFHGVSESSRRSRTVEREIAVSSKQKTPPINKEIIARINNSAFVVSFSTFVKKTDGSKCFLAFPTEISISNLREELRIEAENELASPTPVLVSSDGQHFEGSLVLEDMSLRGIGGKLQCPKDIPISRGALVTGKIENRDAVIPIQATIISYRTVETKGPFQVLRIHASKKAQQIDRRSVEQEKRSEPRIEGDLKLSFYSPFRPNQSFELQVLDISVSGFAAKCVDPIYRQVILPGVSLSLVNSSMIAMIVDDRNDVIRCQWVKGTEPDRAEWMKKISPFYSDSYSVATPIARDLLQLFCESGSLGSDFIASHQPYESRYRHVIEQENNKSGYVHRWIERTREGSLSGHIGAVKVGDNCWTLGDLVGGIRTENRISKDIVGKFMYSFMNFSLSLPTCPRILAIWTRGHGYWTGFQHFLEKELTAEENQAVYMGYTRLSDVNFKSYDLPEIQCSFVDSTDYQTIEKVRSRLDERGLLSIAGIFDFSIDLFGSQNLEEVVRSSNQSFWRQYLITEIDSKKFLSILTKYPMGSNPNRVVDSAWTFQFAGDNPTQEEWLKICDTIKKEGLRLGISVPSVRRVVNDVALILKGVEIEKMDVHVVHPKSLRYFS